MTEISKGWTDLPTGVDLKEITGVLMPKLDALLVRYDVSWEELAYDLRRMMRKRREVAVERGETLDEVYFNQVLGTWIGGYVNGLARAERGER